MIRTRVKTSWFVVALAFAGLLTGCGGGGGTVLQNPEVPAVPNLSITISPASVALSTAQTAQFTVTVTGSSDTAVSWSVNGVAGGSSTLGTINSTGLYTAPSAPTSAVLMIAATSAANPSKSASGTVTLLIPGQVASTHNPQVAQYSFTSPRDATVSIQFGLDTSYGLNTWSQPTPSGGGTVNILVAGMKAFTTYHMRAAVSFPDGVQYSDQDQTFTTGGLPASRIPNITVTQPPGPNTSPGIELLDLNPAGANNYIEAAAIDLNGNVIWYYDFVQNGDGLPFPMKLLSNGRIKIAIGNAMPYFVPPLNVVREIDLAGNVTSELTLDQLNSSLALAGYNIQALGFHHDFAELPNGDTVYLVYQDMNFTDLPGFPGTTTVIGDALVDLDAFGVVRWAWSGFDHLDINYHPFDFPDWTHGNALIYSPTDGNLVLSSRSLSWVMKIDYQNGTGSGAVLWKLGPNGDFTLENGGPSDWFYNQHYPVFLSPTTAGAFELGIWDNGNTRPDPTTGAPCGTPGAIACYSRGVIFNINETAQTAQIQWQDKLPLLALCCGDINVLSNQDVEMGAGATSFTSTEALEVTQQAVPQTTWQININGEFAYRAIRIPSLYPGVTW